MNRRCGSPRLRLAVVLAIVAVSTGAPPAGSYPLANATSQPVNGTNPHGVVAADVNGDGIQDLVSANAGSSNVSVLLGSGGATFRWNVTRTWDDRQMPDLPKWLTRSTHGGACNG